MFVKIVTASFSRKNSKALTVVIVVDHDEDDDDDAWVNLLFHKVHTEHSVVITNARENENTYKKAQPLKGFYLFLFLLVS